MLLQNCWPLSFMGRAAAPGGGGGGGHLYWRLRFPDGAVSGNDQRMALQEIEFRATVSGADQATGGTAFASSALDAFRHPGNCFDDSTGNDWQTSDSGHYNSHIGYQFASGVSVAEISVKASTAAEYHPLSIIVEHSDDGSTYTPFAVIPPLLSWTSGETKTFDLASYPLPSAPAAFRYWRVRSDDTNISGEFMACTELQLRSSIGGSDLTTGKTATASVELAPSWLAPNAIDDNASTFWTTGGTGPPGGGHWLKIDLGSGNDASVVEFVYTSRTDSVREDPRVFFIESSSDGSSWTTRWTRYDRRSWSASETRTYNYIG